jgi:hypothetical protein
MGLWEYSRCLCLISDTVLPRSGFCCFPAVAIKTIICILVKLRKAAGRPVNVDLIAASRPGAQRSLTMRC